MQSAETISAAYDFNLAARDFMFADGAIESVVEAIPWSALIDPSQRSELIFYGQSDRLRGRRHISKGGKFRCDLQEQSRRAMSARVGHRLTFTRHLSSILVSMIKTKPPRYQALIERSITARGLEQKSIM